MFLWLTVLTGIVYPLFITGFAQVTMKKRADGEIIYRHGHPVGSALIAQKFESDKYFWPRPSAVDYNIPSGGSNLGPTSAALKKALEGRKEKIMKAQGANDGQVPSELLFASGSGIDPHISPSTALYQVERIIRARNLNQSSAKNEILKLIDSMTTSRFFGFLGEPYVNVLKLNMALDELYNNQSHSNE